MNSAHIILHFVLLFQLLKYLVFQILQFGSELMTRGGKVILGIILTVLKPQLRGAQWAEINPMGPVLKTV